MLNLSDKEKEVLKALIRGLPISKRPFYEIAKKLNLEEKEVLEIIKNLLEKKIIRRLGITLRHNLAGIEGNALVAIEVPEEKVEEVGNYLASLPYISHCYLRKTYEDWKYNLYIMIHGKDEKEVKEKLESILKRFDISKYEIFFTEKEIVRKHANYDL